MLLLSLTFLLYFNSPVLTQNPVQNFIEIENYVPDYQNYQQDYAGNYLLEPLKCPDHWIPFQQYCYKFIKSPMRPYVDARTLCQVSCQKHQTKKETI